MIQWIKKMIQMMKKMILKVCSLLASLGEILYSLSPIFLKMKQEISLRILMVLMEIHWRILKWMIPPLHLTIVNSSKRFKEHRSIKKQTLLLHRPPGNNSHLISLIPTASYKRETIFH